MKTKNKVIALLEIGVVLCSVFLVAIPAIAAEQTTQKVSASEVTTASEDDYVLGVYGNANEDDTIDMRDLTYVKLIFFGKKSETELADAKYDGKINPLDFIKIKLIIVGKERELTIVDSADRIVTVKKPVERIVVTHRHSLETLRTLKVPKDIIAGVTSYAIGDAMPIYFAEYKDIPGVGSLYNFDIEAILDLKPDVVILCGPCSWLNAKIEPAQKVFEAAEITVLRFYSTGGCIEADSYPYPEEVKKLGYIFDKKKEAEEFIEFYIKYMNSIKVKVEKIPEEDKPSVYYEGHAPYYLYGERWARCEFAGGKNILDTEYGNVDPEAVVERNPDIIIKVAPGWPVTGYHLDPDDTTEIEKVKEEIMNRLELQNVKAVKDGRVYVMSAYFLSGMGYSGVRGFLQIAYNAKWFHPEIFKDMNPQAIHQEYLTRFQGLDIDLDEKGVFVYPEPR
jgi:iron complex transport system substrate-binding protein